MTYEDTKALLTLIATNYPNAYKDVQGQARKLLVDTWHELLADFDPILVRYAVRECIKTSKFAPAVSEILDVIKAVPEIADTDESDWLIASKMIRKGTVITEEEFMEAPPHVREWFGSRSAIKELALQDAGTLETVTRGQFMRKIGTIKDRLRKQGETPDIIKELARKALNENNDKRDTAITEQVPGQRKLMGVQGDKKTLD